MPIGTRRGNPKIHIFGEGGGSIQDGSLPADEEIPDFDRLKPLEKASHRECLSGYGAVYGEPNCGATDRQERD